MNTGAPKFPLGGIVGTSNALSRLTGEDIQKALSRHVVGDWGDLDQHDMNENELGLRHGLRLFSAYRDQKGTRFWIITEADRSVTTILLPEDY